MKNIPNTLKATASFLAMATILFGCNSNNKENSAINQVSSDQVANKLTPLPFNKVKLEDSFWLPRLKTQKEILVPFALDKTIPAVENLEKTARFLKGDTNDLPFPHRYISSDLYKVMEGAALILRENPDSKLESRMDSIIDIIANAQNGGGGNIEINAESLLGIQERMAIEGNQTNDIDASSQFSLDGKVIINTVNLNPLQEATELPSNIVNPEQIVAQGCKVNRELTAQNSLTLKGKGGISDNPTLPLNSRNISIDGETNSTSTIAEPIETSQGKIRPARGINRNESGEIILTAYRTNNSGSRFPKIKRNCGSV